MISVLIDFRFVLALFLDFKIFFLFLEFYFGEIWVKFYKKKVQQVMAEADDLSRQMDALIALRVKVDNLAL